MPDQQNHQQILDLQVSVTPEHVLRMMGCRKGQPVRPEVRDLVDRLLAETRELLVPRGIYTMRRVERMADDELVIEGCPPIRGSIAGFLKPARRVAAFVLTVGPEVEHLATRRMDGGATLEGFALNAIGSAAADLASDALSEEVYWREAGPTEGITPPYSPGYCGMALEEQEKLFSIVDAARIGVRLWPTMIMEPIKSVSGLLGIGDAQEVMSHGVPCQWCDLETCRMRRG